MKWILLCLLLITLIPASSQVISAKTFNHPPNWRASLDPLSNMALMEEMVTREEMKADTLSNDGFRRIYWSFGQTNSCGNSHRLSTVIGEFRKRMKVPITICDGSGWRVNIERKFRWPFGPGHAIYERLLICYKRNQSTGYLVN